MAYTKRDLALSVLALAGVLLFVTVVARTFAYYRTYKPALRPLTFVSAAGRLEESLQNTDVFEPPDSGELTAQQWDRYGEVESAVQRVVGAAMQTLTARRTALLAGADAQTGSVSLQAALSAVGEIGPLYFKAKSEQVAAMNRADLPRDEYRWIRRQVFASAGIVLAELDLEGMKSAARDRATTVEVTMTTAATTGQNANLRVISKRRASLEAWLVLAFFDL
jgi:hypothetical protein